MAASPPGVRAEVPDEAPVETPAGESAGACALSDAELEALGARIGHVAINALDIFDVEDPQEDKALFRAMNRLHVRTRGPVIRRQLLFDTGDPFFRQRLDESERILRNTDYLYDAEIVITACDEGTVDIKVTTQDVWTL